MHRLAQINALEPASRGSQMEEGFGNKNGMFIFFLSEKISLKPKWRDLFFSFAYIWEHAEHFMN